MWLVIGIVAGRGVGGTLTSTLQISAFLILVGLGQLLVIASGNGNIDLSVPNVITLSSLLALGVARSGHGSTLAGIGVGLAGGLAVAAANVTTIFVLGVPPIIATLAVGLLTQSAALERAQTFQQLPPPGLQNFVTERVAGIPVIALVALGVTLLVALLLHRTVFGRTVLAAGQNRKAAKLAGLHETAAMVGCYAISSILAALAGIGLAAFSGPSITLGDPYLLTSIAAVVLGGSLIAGGRANVLGIWSAALLLNLIVTAVYVLKLSVGVQDIVEGAVVIVVVVLSGSTLRERA